MSVFICCFELSLIGNIFLIRRVRVKRQRQRGQQPPQVLSRPSQDLHPMGRRRNGPRRARLPPFHRPFQNCHFLRAWRNWLPLRLSMMMKRALKRYKMETQTELTLMSWRERARNRERVDIRFSDPLGLSSIDSSSLVLNIPTMA